MFCERQGQLDRARQTLEAAVTSPVSVPLLLDLARVAYKSKDLKGTLGYLAHARDLEPGNFGVHFFFGIVCAELDLLIDATKSLKEAAALSPEDPYANFALGSVLMQSSEPLDGLPYVQKYCRLKPKDPRGRLALGAAYFRVGEHDLAQEELEAVVALPEAAAGADYFLGRIAKLQGNREEAYRLIQLSVKANSDYADALVELGQLEMRHRRITPQLRKHSSAQSHWSLTVSRPICTCCASTRPPAIHEPMPSRSYLTRYPRNGRRRKPLSCEPLR